MTDTPRLDPSALARGFPVILTTTAWLALVGARAFAGVGEALVAFAIAAIVPLGLHLGARSRPETSPPTKLEHVANRIVVAVGPLGVLSFAFPPGKTAALLASAWLAATLVVGLAGGARMVRRRVLPLEELTIDVARLYLPIGAVWLVASRAGVALLGFREPIVLYTAAHFHFAGFAAPTVVGLMGRDLGFRAEPPTQKRPWAYSVAACVVMAGVPLVAAGIALSRSLETPSAILLGLGMLQLSGFLMFSGLRRLFRPVVEPPLTAFERARWRVSGLCLFVSGFSLVGSMMLAIAFALTGSAGHGATDGLIPYATMAAFHGIANAIGFATMAFLGFFLSPKALERAEHGREVEDVIP